MLFREFGRLWWMPPETALDGEGRVAPPGDRLELAAVACVLMLGGSTTFLLNFLRALRPEEGRMRVICPDPRNEMAADFAAVSAEVRTADLRHLIYEDRLTWTYRETAAGQPRGVLACLGSESYEMLRLAPPGVARIGLIQSHDPGLTRCRDAMQWARCDGGSLGRDL